MRNDTEERESLKEIEASWKSGVLEAQANYRRAFTQHQQILEELDRVLVESAEDSIAVEKARLAMAAALDEVVRTQEILVGLVLRRDMPSQNDDERLAQ